MKTENHESCSSTCWKVQASIWAIFLACVLFTAIDHLPEMEHIERRAELRQKSITRGEGKHNHYMGER